MSVVIDNHKFHVVDEEDLNFKKISPMAEEHMGILREDKGTKVMRDKFSLKHVCEEDVPLNKNIGKQSGDLKEKPSEAVEQGMHDHVPDMIDGAKYEQVPNHVVNK
nr:hypothetical protein [Tanacetum cinerariifolium]GEY80287.1 hypothetical protein [Tanacetum cinerariifolium]